MQQVQIGLIGAGTVGSGVFQALEQNSALLDSRIGLDLRVSRIAVRDPKRSRTVDLPRERVTSDWRQVVEDPNVQIIAELMGGVTLAKEVVLAALKAGKPVVTANKALISAHGEALFAASRKHRVNLYYEASVAGGIPIIKLLRESLVGNQFTHIYGIVNGTCNYILSRMKAEGAAFDTVLADAQNLGYAEAEPSLDVDGHDAAHKTGILASLAHGVWVRPEQIHTEGIRGVHSLDIQFAAQLGYVIKLLGIIKAQAPAPHRASSSKRDKSGGANPSESRIQVSVYPALIPQAHVLASVNDVFNAVAIRGNIVGDTLFYGRGAGADATASSVLSDLADAALDLKFGSHHRVPPFVAHNGKVHVASIDDTISPYYVRLQVLDRPGVFARIAKVLGDADIGISSIFQPEGHVGDSVPVILMLHDAPYGVLRRALSQIRRLSAVKEPPHLIRVESLT